MLDWRTGAPTARWWTLKLFIDTLGSSNKTFHTIAVEEGTSVYAFAVSVAASAPAEVDRKVVIMVNTGAVPVQVQLQDTNAGSVFVVDEAHGNGAVPYSQGKWAPGAPILLQSFAVAAVVAGT